MKIYRLEPVKDRINDAGWQNSNYKGVVIVRASSKDGAFRLAYTAFAEMTPAAKAVRPWNQGSGLVVCDEVDDAAYSAEGEEEILEPRKKNRRNV